MKLYKYTTALRGLQILENNSVVLSNPLYFNDPFDCFPRWDDIEFEKACEFIIDFALEQSFVKLLKDIASKKERFKGKNLVKFVLLEYSIIKN